MKIIYVENVRIPSSRAHAYQIAQTCAWFARLGNDVTLVNPDRAHDEDVFSTYGLEPNIFTHVTLRAFDPLSLSWFPFKKIAYFLQRFFFVRSLRAWAKKQTADIWYTRDPAMIDALQDLPCGRWALELHDMPNSNRGRWERIREHVSIYIAISKGLIAWLSKEGIHATWSPDGFDPEEMKHLKSREEARQILGLPSDVFVALYTGTFYPWKGVDLVVRAWAKAPSNAHLVIIGGPEDDRRRLEQCIEPIAQNRIHLLPMMTRSRVTSLLRAGDVGLVTTSPRYRIGRECTSPLKQFEYLAAGLPILATDVPSSHDILDTEIARFYQYSEEDFVSVLQQSMADNAWHENAILVAKEKGSLYSWEARAKRILKALSV